MKQHTIGDETVKVRELGRRDRAVVAQEAAALLAEMRAAFNDGPPPVLVILAIADRHAGAWCSILARASGRTPEWVANLSDTEVNHLSLAFLACGTGFWRLVSRAGQAVMEA